MCRLLFYQLNKLLFRQFTGMVEFERFGNNYYCCDRWFFPSQKYEICSISFEWLVNPCSLYIIMFAKNWVICTDEVSNFSENSLKIYLTLISFLPSIFLSDIFQPLLGISLQVLASISSNLPILSNLTLFDKIFPSSHKSYSSVRSILSLLRYIVFLLNYIFFC